MVDGEFWVNTWHVGWGCERPADASLPMVSGSQFFSYAKEEHMSQWVFCISCAHRHLREQAQKLAVRIVIPEPTCPEEFYALRCA